MVRGRRKSRVSAPEPKPAPSYSSTRRVKIVDNWHYYLDDNVDPNDVPKIVKINDVRREVLESYRNDDGTTLLVCKC